MIVSTFELSDVLETRLGNVPNQSKKVIAKKKRPRISDEQENRKKPINHISPRMVMPQLIPQNNLDEIIGAISRAKTLPPIHRIGIKYGNKEKADDKKLKDTYDPTDSAQRQRDIKDRVYITDRLDVYFLEQEKQVTFDFSYIGSGVMRGAYNTVKDEFRAAADKWDAPPTPEQAGKLLMRILGEAVMKAGDHIDPNTKERMLFWMKTPEGAVWRVFYEMIAPVKTANYNFTHVS